MFLFGGGGGGGGWSNTLSERYNQVEALDI